MGLLFAKEKDFNAQKPSLRLFVYISKESVDNFIIIRLVGQVGKNAYEQNISFSKDMLEYLDGKIEKIDCSDFLKNLLQ